MTAPAPAPFSSSTSALPPERAKSADVAIANGGGERADERYETEDESEEIAEEDAEVDMSVPGAFAVNSRSRWLRHGKSCGACDEGDNCDCFPVEVI